MPTAGNGPVPLNSLVASPDNETPITDQPATQSGAVVQTTPPVSPPPVEVDESESEQEINDIEAGVHALGACEELFRRSNVTTTALRGRGLTVESLIRQALAQIGTPFDLDDDMAGLPATYTHAYDWDLLVGEDCVFITTRLQVNLHKEARVYRIPAALEVSAEELAVVIRRTVRPWSWRAQIDEVIGSIEMELPPEASLPAIPRVTGIDLTGAGDLVQIAAADVDATEADKGPERADSAAAWYSIKALGSLLSSGTIAAAHAVINTTEMLHYADPPTATMQVLPGMLIVSQSQGAHREIADLFQLIEDSARN